MYAIYLGIGSNLGDRQGNILQAVQKLRSFGEVDAVSAFYETQPAAGALGPAFLNVAAKISTALEPHAFERAVRGLELAVGRQRARHLAARIIDVDILAIDSLVRDFGRFEVPHPYLSSRAFNLVPLGEIAPSFVDPVSGKTVAALIDELDSAARSGIAKKIRSLTFAANRQDGEPAVKLSIDRVGVSGVKRIIHLEIAGKQAAFNGAFSMVADLAPDRAGVHMSRFSELLEAATLDVLARSEKPGRIEDIVAAIAGEIVETQQAARADVRLRAEFSLERYTPVSGKRTEETYALLGIAHADAHSVRSVVGVEAEGMTACPCAQLMVREDSFRELCDAGFSKADADRALDVLPAATHNQRGRGTLFIGAPDGYSSDVLAQDLVDIVENSMSSETYDLLKRPDEFFIVNKAHRNPKFVEDVVRDMLLHTLQVFGDFPDESFVSATHINFESIHKHDAFAEAFGTFGELREELRTGRAAVGKTSLATWLDTSPSLVTASSMHPHSS